jgi:hypothetical protein
VVAVAAATWATAVVLAVVLAAVMAVGVATWATVERTLASAALERWSTTWSSRRFA